MHRLYETEDISIFWNSDKCRHAKKCVTGSPKTFDINRKPWIDPSRDETPRIWKAISQCPSGALGVVYNHSVRVELDEAGKRSIAILDGNMIGECAYADEGDACNIYHTQVLAEYEGMGIAKRLVYKVIEAAEKRKKKLMPTCSYAVKVLQE